MSFDCVCATPGSWRRSCHPLILFRSSDLITCDFLLWGFFESKVYRDTLPSARTLKDVIFQHVSAIPQAMLFSIVNDVAPRLTDALLNDGQYIE
ncbi:hypothetical protein AVEN_164048-1 [Araneus ventricosus]|uniref:Uncharacterized protein n=1 Tax=Araneus ventricosus TaxID=182803 RepID=A0A4Y2KJT2_ARAVE|nr:hypothetical protein AVEN_155899-1 [Araneus ventricosus]GBN02006.1 hypothetical protein AVEN_167807-1 [Araneus ventricosus]GBN03715.1 hypothetical protein AVEN_47629-1 [Araneus ventricosus]GBN03761.1 hypothetical protein AVEN_164048-1 [Araneus ventricosus]